MRYHTTCLHHGFLQPTGNVVKFRALKLIFGYTQATPWLQHVSLLSNGNAVEFEALNLTSGYTALHRNRGDRRGDKGLLNSLNP